MADTPKVRDPMTGRLLPGARLSGAGNPLARAHYEYRKRFIDAATDDEWNQARAKLVEDVLSPDPKIRAMARPMYFELMCGRNALQVEFTRGDDVSTQSEAEATLARVLRVLEGHPGLKSEVADALLDDMPQLEATTTEVLGNGHGN